MKIAKALKVKNRLAGELAHLRQLIQVNNVTENENKPAMEVAPLLKEMDEKQLQLIDLKAKIDVANGPVWVKIVAMGELRARVAWLRAIPVREGEFIQLARFGGGEPVKTVYHSSIRQVDVEREVKELIARIDQLQDEIDAFNATTDV